MDIISRSSVPRKQSRSYAQVSHNGYMYRTKCLVKFHVREVVVYISILSEVGFKRYTEDPRYNDSVCYQRFCCKIEFAVLKKLDRDPSKA